MIFRDYRNEKARTFIYADPPYLDVGNNYEDCKWKDQDTIDLFDVLMNSGIRFAMSEFDNPKVIAMAKERGLNIHIIGERRNLHNRRTEILITNYEIEKENNLFE
jgi:DNA adenine methylase